MRAGTIKRMLRDRVDVTPQQAGGVDEFGQPQDGTPVQDVPARVVRAQRRSVTPQGEEFISQVQVAMLRTVRVGDEITVPHGGVYGEGTYGVGSYNGKAYPVRAVQRAPSLHGGAELTEARL